MKTRMFTKRSTAGAIAAAWIVGAGFERLLGMPVGLAATNGLAAGILAWAAFFQLRNWSFLVQLWTPKSGAHRAVVLYAALLVLVTFTFLSGHLQSERAVEIGFQSLFLLVGFTAFQLGSIGSILLLTDDREPATWGSRAAKAPLLTAVSTIVAVTAGLFVMALQGFGVGAAWGLAAMNGLAAGTIVAVFAFQIRTGQMGGIRLGTPMLRPWAGVSGAGQLLIMWAAFQLYAGPEFRVDLGIMFSLLMTGYAATVLGMHAGTLGHVEAIEGAGDPVRHVSAST